ncbi:DUF3043 domain-containing protein [Pseudoscardovia radai]|uniref:DUF3043 domain-containing protein n=1 Tax=Pseudoscardovia radai TaxID=987066 RepID=UPI0039966CA8
MAHNKTSDTSDSADSQASPAATGMTPGKGRPTPKRKDAQKASLRPLVPADRKAAKKAERAKAREKQDREYQAMETGDVQHMPTSERIPWRIYVRDYVDARRNLGEWFMPIVFIALIVSMIVQRWSPVAAFVLMIVVYVYLLAVIIDAVLMWRSLKKKLVAKYGDKAVAKGQRTGLYAWTRALQIRAWRMPKPRYKKHGNWPD